MICQMANVMGGSQETSATLLAAHDLPLCNNFTGQETEGTAGLQRGAFVTAWQHRVAAVRK